jgi:parallel beta-helix repeat protein
MQKMRGTKVYAAIGLGLALLLIIAFFDNNSKEYNISNCQIISKPGNYHLTGDIPDVGLPCIGIVSDDVLIDGQGFSISGSNKNNSGAINIISHDNITIKNLVMNNLLTGIYAKDSKSIKVINNTFINVLSGIFFFNITQSSINSNTIDSSKNAGIVMYFSYGNDLSGNTISKSLFSFGLHESDDNIFSSNMLVKNVNPYININRSAPLISVSNATAFFFDLPFSKDEPDCNNCSYDLKITPYENSLKTAVIGNRLIGYFVPSQRGIYSVKLSATDPSNNTEIVKYIYLVGSPKQEIINYYLRGVDPTHGQALSWGIYKQDSGSLLTDSPSSDEVRSCSDWVQFAPDKVPEYLFGVVNNINFAFNYNSSHDGVVGIQRFGGYNMELDFYLPLESHSQIQSKNLSFNVSWAMNYYWAWYWQSIKMVTDKGDPSVFIDKEEPSIASITYLYSDTPAITHISNPDVTLLSATMPDSRKNQAFIQLEGEGLTELGIKMPNDELSYVIINNGQKCDKSDFYDDSMHCSVLNQNSGIINLLIRTKGYHNIEIVPAA